MPKSWKRRLSSARSRVLDNWPIKLTALVLAAILWAAVAAQEPTTQLVAVRLEVQPPPGRALTSELPEVQALYAGSARELIKLYAQPPMIRKPLPDTISGAQYMLELSLSDLEVADGADVRAQRLEPRSIAVQLDDVSLQVVPVSARVTVQPDTGYQLFADVSVLPSEITVRGPDAAVARITSVMTEALMLQGIREPVRRRLAIDTTGLGAVRLSNSEVEIFADVGAVSERVLMGVPVLVRGGGPGQWISDPPAVIVTVRGRRGRIAAFTRDSISVYAMRAGGFSDSVAALEVLPPNGVIGWAIPDSVTLRRAPRD
ncbi:MAG: YbbR-like domain-containing protein [Gemmatimonadota bacterium]|nr:YbbR-like domain-containing protein [Gemmatimonadota bacterium]